MTFANMQFSYINDLKKTKTEAAILRCQIEFMVCQSEKWCNNEVSVFSVIGSMSYSPIYVSQRKEKLSNAEVIRFWHSHFTAHSCHKRSASSPWCLHSQFIWHAGYMLVQGPWTKALLWRHNGRDGVSNFLPHDCLLNRSFRRRSKKTSKLRVTGLCAGNSLVTGEFPAQMASNAENVFFDYVIMGRRK